MSCPDCGSDHIIEVTTDQDMIIYECEDCGYGWVEEA